MAKADLTAQHLRELLEYNEQSGVFRWRRHAQRNGVKQHAKAGCINTPGYRVIRIDRMLYAAHRLAWLYVHGEWPKMFIDHINGQRSDNRIENLRDVPAASNSHNLKSAKSASKSGVLGVCWSKEMKKWHATIVAGYKQHRLGYFDDIQDAKRAYEAAKLALHDAPVSHRSPS